MSRFVGEDDDDDCHDENVTIIKREKYDYTD